MRNTWYLLICLLLASAGLNAQAPVKGKAPAQDPLRGEPVIINRDTLFKFYTGQGLFETQERAAIVTKRIKALVNRIDFNPDSLTLKNDSTLSVIYYNSQIVMAVNNKDATYSELNRPQLAANYLLILKQKLGNYFTNNNSQQVVVNILEAIAVIILLIALIWALFKASRWLKLKLLRAWEARMDKLASQGAPVVYAHRLLPVVTGLLRIIRVVIIVVLVYLALPVLFYIFPSSKPISVQLLGYVVTPFKGILLAIVRYIPNLLTIAVIYCGNPLHC
jgi:hypothetical protein